MSEDDPTKPTAPKPINLEIERMKRKAAEVGKGLADLDLDTFVLPLGYLEQLHGPELAIAGEIMDKLEAKNFVPVPVTQSSIIDSFDNAKLMDALHEYQKNPDAFQDEWAHALAQKAFKAFAQSDT